MMMKRNESFVCAFCQTNVPIHAGVSRNHCPHCFHSKHVDIIPWDRQSLCHWEMLPYQYIWKTSGIIIEFICMTCNATHRNIQAKDDEIQFLDEKVKQTQNILLQ